MSVLSLSYWEIDVTVQNISHTLPHIMAGKIDGVDMVRKNYVTVTVCIVTMRRLPVQQSVEVCDWLQPSDELSPFFSTTEPFYPASYYFNHAPPSRYPVGSNISPDNVHPAWKPPAHRGQCRWIDGHSKVRIPRIITVNNNVKQEWSK